MILDGFPGVLKRIKKHGANHIYSPTPEQEAWILRQYANHDVFTADIAETIGASISYVHRLCHQHGLHHKIGLMRRNTKQLLQTYEDKKNEVINTTRFTPDKDLLAIVSKDHEERTIGRCVGKRCFNYDSPLCYCQMKNPATGRTSLQHRTECNAIF